MKTVPIYSTQNPAAIHPFCRQQLSHHVKNLDHRHIIAQIVPKAALAAIIFLTTPTTLPASANTDNFTLSVKTVNPADEYFETVPQALDSGDSKDKTPRMGSLISGAGSEKNQRLVTNCTKKCVPTCIRGGQGAPGLGPMSVRRETGGVVFKEGYRTRTYCLGECVEICALEVKAENSSNGSKK
jgi:hypothetical protein